MSFCSRFEELLCRSVVVDCNCCSGLLCAISCAGIIFSQSLQSCKLRGSALFWAGRAALLELPGSRCSCSAGGATHPAKYSNVRRGCLFLELCFSTLPEVALRVRLLGVMVAFAFPAALPSSAALSSALFSLACSKFSEEWDFVNT